MLIVSQDKKNLVFTDSGVVVYVDENFLMTTSAIWQASATAR